MEDLSPSRQYKEILASANIRGHGQSNSENVQDAGYRKDKVPKILQSPILSPQERFSGKQNHTRSVKTKRVYLRVNIQDAHPETSEIATPTTCVDGSTRFSRRFLSLHGQQSLQTIPRVPLQGSELEIQSHAIRPERRTEVLHEDCELRSTPPGKGRDMVSTIPGRSADNRNVEGTVPAKVRKSTEHPEEARLDYQLTEVPNGTQTGIRLARSPLQPNTTYGEQHAGEPQQLAFTTQRCIEQRHDHQTQDHAITGTRELAGTCEPTSQTFSQQDEATSETSQVSPPRQEPQSDQPHEISPRQLATPAKNIPKTRSPRTNIHNPVGCLTNRLGIQNKSTMVQGRLPQVDGRILHKCIRAAHDMVGNVDDYSPQSSDQNIDRQYSSDIGCQENNLEKQHSSRPCRANMEEGNSVQLDLIHSTHTGEIQHSSRPAFQEYGHLDGMGDSPTHISQGDSQARTKARSGLICHNPQSSVGDIRVPMPGHESLSSGCSENRLVPMEPYISVSPNANDFYGFSKNNASKHRERNRDFKRGTITKLVSPPEIQADTGKDNHSQIATNSREHTAVGPQNFQTSRLEVLKLAYKTKYPGCDTDTINLMSTPIKKSSESDYQGKWKQFLKYIQERGIPFESVKDDIVLGFLSYLFHTRGLKPSTVGHYRSALSKPLLLHLNIDLRKDAVCSMIRSMRQQRPHEPPPRPAWSLSKVLEYLESLDTASTTNSLRKTSFLLLLATVWRISELHACVRNTDHCRFTENASLLLQPHSSFLAKNGLRQRIAVKEIRTLTNREGITSNICPVSALREYLEHTPNQKEGCLFTNPKDNKSISLFQLRYQICSLITQADPQTKAKVHDIRKYAASCSLQQDMLIGDLTEDFNWSTPAIFYKYYFIQTDPLSMPVVLPSSG